MFRRPAYFITYSKKVNNGLDDTERSERDTNYYKYSCTKRGDKIVGISLLCRDFGQELQEWERFAKNGSRKQSAKQPEEQADKNGKETDSYVLVNELGEEAVSDILKIEDSQGNDPDAMERKVVQGEILEDFADEKAQKNFSELLNSSKKDKNQDNQDEGQNNRIDSWEGEAEKRKKRAWEKRKKIFKNFDRIALFQFKISSSYDPPEAEEYHGACENERDNEREDENRNREISSRYPSFEEYRRRKLLEPVLHACDKFDVEILLLPEYSVRPETVEWMSGIIEKRGYKFSVWAGTFKVPAGYQFIGTHWKNPEPEILNSKKYWHSAILPIILNENGKNIQIICRKYKKYPALQLKEEFNPVPAFDENSGQDGFAPVMKKIKKTFSNDAIEDVIELICAEVFAFSNISNYPSFLDKSYELYLKYKSNVNSKDEKGYDKWLKGMLNEIKEFGKYTALYQYESRSDRTPILLIPAWTTRAVDFYLIGQENYLAAGIKMVFCNSTRKTASGGSCYLGRNSWDNHNLKKGKYPPNTIYHGLNPGIYMQTSKLEDGRGALGEEEQALLICDVDPLQERTNPNAVSRLESLSIVAHIPILEENIDSGDKTKKEFSNGAGGSCDERKDESHKETRSRLETIVKHCSKKYNTTMEDIPKDVEEVKKSLEYLGKKHKSQWLEKRAEYYQKYYRKLPQSWPPPTLLDWIYVEVDKEEFRNSVKNSNYNDGEGYYIYIPKDYT